MDEDYGIAGAMIFVIEIDVTGVFLTDRTYGISILLSSGGGVSTEHNSGSMPLPWERAADRLVRFVRNYVTIIISIAGHQVRPARLGPLQRPRSVSERNQVRRSVSSIQVSIKLAVATSLCLSQI